MNDDNVFHITKAPKGQRDRLPAGVTKDRRKSHKPPCHEAVRLSDVVRLLTVSTTTFPDHDVAVECLEILCQYFDDHGTVMNVPIDLKRKVYSMDRMKLLSWMDPEL